MQKSEPELRFGKHSGTEHKCGTVTQYSSRIPTPMCSPISIFKVTHHTLFSVVPLPSRLHLLCFLLRPCHPVIPKMIPISRRPSSHISHVNLMLMVLEVQLRTCGDYFSFHHTGCECAQAGLPGVGMGQQMARLPCQEQGPAMCTDCMLSESQNPRD